MEDHEKKESIVEEARERFRKGHDANETFRRMANEDTRFALADSENGWAWDSTMFQSRQFSKKPCLTINVSAQHCNKIINDIRMNRPAKTVSAEGGGATKKTAEIIAGICRKIQQQSDADNAHDIAATHSIYGGEGYWRVITEYENESSFKQRPRIKSITNPRLVIIDHTATEMDKSDAEWGFVFEDISKDQARREYSGKDIADWEKDSNGWVSEDTVRRAEYFYCEYIDDTALLLADGTSIFKSEAQGNEQVIKSRKTKRKQWKWCTLLGNEDKPVDERDWPGKYLPIISVSGVEVNIDGEIVKKGVIRDLKDMGRIINYAYSGYVESLSLQNKVPYIAPVEAIDGFKNEWAHANESTAAYLPYNQYDKNTGERLDKPERQQPPNESTAHLNMLMISTEQMRAASGQQASNFGIKSEAQSGIGIQRLQQQGDIATFHFPDNLARALKYELKILVDLIPKIMDVEQVVKFVNLDGSEGQALLSPDMQQSHSEANISEDIKDVFNPGIGDYGVTIDTGPNYQTQRQEAADKLTELMGKDPALMQIAGDLYFNALDIPNSEAFAERLKKALPPGLVEDDKDGQPQQDPQVAQMGQQMEQMAQQMEEMSQALQQAQLESQKLQSDSDTELQKAQAQYDMNIYKKEVEILKTKADMMKYETKTDKEKAIVDIDAKIKELDFQIKKNEDNEEMNREQYNDVLTAINMLKESIPAPQEKTQDPQMFSSMMAQLHDLMAEINKPKVSKIDIMKQPDGSYSGIKTEISSA